MYRYCTAQKVGFVEPPCCAASWSSACSAEMCRLDLICAEPVWSGAHRCGTAVACVLLDATALGPLIAAWPALICFAEGAVQPGRLASAVQPPFILTIHDQ